MKRQADIVDAEVREKAFDLSKSDWTDLYFDLFKQVFGESSTETAIMGDAERRLKILADYRRHESA